MKIKITLVIIQLFLFGIITLHSQVPNCNSLNSADILCNVELLNGITGTMNSEDSGGLQPFPLCSTGGAVDNILWFALSAPEGGPYTITISIDNCVNDTTIGIQVGLYTDCTFSESVYCKPECNLEDASIPSLLLEPGQVYYLFIDGCFNTVCDYEIKLEGSIENDFQVSGQTFIDYNADGVQSGLEPDLENVNISLNPGNLMTLSNNEGYFSFEEVPMDSFSITASILEGEWEEDEIVIEIAEFVSCVPIEIGFVPLPNSIPDASVSISNSIARCNGKTKFYISIQNNSNNTLDGTFEFTYDDLTSFVSSDIPGLIINGNTALANTGAIAPFEIKDYLVTLQMPAESDPLPELQFEITVFDNAQMSIAEYAYSDQLRCSYDPNDKKEHPDRPGAKNLTLIEEDLEYKIRFQNNGNDTAFFVKIVDQLDPNINPLSVRVINSSHPLETRIEESKLEFLFRDIMLVDSTTNYDDSQGFVTFRCNVNETIAENTEVINQADIIFDLNSPIITNSTLNTFVSELCSSVTVEMSIDICDGETFMDYDSTGIFTIIDMLNFGCDSTTIIDLTVQESEDSNLSLEVCEDDSVVINNKEYLFSESTEFVDTIFDDIGCISVLTFVDVTVHPIQMIQVDTTICEGMDYNGFTVSGVYTLDSIDLATGCDIFTTIDLVVLPASDPSCIVGIDDLNVNDIKLYPNPALDLFFIESNSSIETITILNTAFQKVDDFEILNRQQKIQFSTQNLTKGLYIVAIKSGNKVFYKKLIVE